jgi:Tfp pilus assembly protein PilZ
MRDGESEIRGFVTDVSANGVFVQTQNRPALGCKVVLTLECEGPHPLVLTGAVARVLKSHHAAGSVIQSGVGIQIESAPEEFFQLVNDLDRDG